MRGGPTVAFTRVLERTEQWSLDALRDLQAGLLHRLVRHASAHTAHYRTVLQEHGLTPDDIRSVDDLRLLPLLDRDLARASFEARTATVGPTWVVKKATSGGTGSAVDVRYSAESQRWRDATRWRAYGWAGYRSGMRALRYWGAPPQGDRWLARVFDRVLGRELHVDCTVRSEPALAHAVREIERFQPEVIVAHAGGAAALARFVNDHGLRTWGDRPVIVGAERLWPFERGQIRAAFGPAFETYGCREVALIGAECEAHDGMHTAMENLIVELVVRDPDGTVRAARPGESGLVAITDLHNLACPMIRYVPGDVAVARVERPCACGRALTRIGPIEGRLAEARTDAFDHAADLPVSSAALHDVVVGPHERPAQAW